MKKMTIILAVMMLSWAARASLLPKGTSELDVSGLLDFKSFAGTSIGADLAYGYFFVDYLELAGRFQFSKDDNFTTWAVGPEAEYNFDIGTEIVPFIGGSFLYKQTQTKVAVTTETGTTQQDEDDNAIVFGFHGGVKYFITEYLALSAALELSLATKEVFPSDGDLSKSDAGIRLDMSVFF